MPKPALDIYYYPMLTVKADGHDRIPQVVACFGIALDGPTACFAQLAKVAWLSALQCRFKDVALNRPFPITLDMLGRPFPEDPAAVVRYNGQVVANDGDGLRESLRVTTTLARGTSNKPLDFDRITTLLRANFDSRLRGVGTATFSPVYFPPIPGLLISSSAAGYNYNFRLGNSRTSTFEDRMAAYMQGLRLQCSAGPLSRPGRSRRGIGFAVLTFEQYFDRLITLVNNLFYDMLSDRGGTAELGALLDAARFNNVAGALNSEFSSGMRLPEGFSADSLPMPTGDTSGFYEWTGQQFPATGFDDTDAQSPFDIRFSRYASNPPTWLDILTGEDEPNTVRVDGPLIAGLAATTPPLVVRNVQPLIPLRAGARRFSLSPPQGWLHSDGTSFAIVEFPKSVRREISQLAEQLGGSSPYDRVKVELFTEEASGGLLDAPGLAPTTTITDYRWATAIPLRIRRVLNTTVDSGGGEAPPIAAMYELVGMSEVDRRLLDQALEEYAASPPEVFLLYRNGTVPDPFFRSDALDMSVSSGQCVVLRTSLSTESAPFEPSLRPGRRAAGITDAEHDVAVIGEGLNFLRLIQQACIVNSGGYFLHYSPAQGSDPLRAVFDAAGGRPVFVTLLLKYSAVSASPHPRPYYTAAVGPPLVTTGGATRYIFANVLRQSKYTGQFFALQKYDPCLPQGAVGFSVARDIVPDPGEHVTPPTAADREAQAQFYLDRMFTRLSYQVNLPADEVFRQFPLTLPVTPMESGPGAPTEWKWNHAIQVVAKPFDQPYAAIGRTVSFAFAFRDIFGNELPAAGAHTGLSVRMRYFDSLVAISQWPGLRTDFGIDAGGTQLVVNLSANPFQAQDDGSGAVVFGITPEQRFQIYQVYQSILAQLMDPNTTAFLEVVSPGASSPRPINCLTTLIDFIRQITDPRNVPDPEPILEDNFIRGNIVLGRPTFDSPADFFPLSVQIRIERDTIDDNFWQVVDPWEDGGTPTSHIDEPIRKVASPVGLPGALEGSDKPPGMEIFARAFETLYSADGLKVATSEDSLGQVRIWLLRMNALRPTLRRTPPSPEGVPLVFAPRPLSNQLLWATLPQVPPSAPAEFPLKQQQVSDVDFDIKTRDFLKAIEGILEPATVSAILSLGESTTEPQFGRKRFQTIMTAKRSLSQSLPSLLVDILYLNGPPPSTCAETTARSAFRQHMLNTLNAAYGIDVILQFNAIPSSEMTSDQAGGGIALFGKVTEVPLGVGSSRTSLNFRNDKIRFRANRSLYPPRLTVLVDEPLQSREPQERPLKFVWTHIEYDIPSDTLDCGVNAEFQKSKWLTLLIPDDLLIHSGEDICFPIPLREHPRPPRVTSHRGIGDASAAQIDSALRWTYEWNFESGMEWQDELDIELELNSSQNRLSFADGPAAVPESLFQELMYFHAAFPSPDTAYAAMRSAGGVAVLKIFADRVDRVASEFDTWLALGSGEPLPSLVLRFRLRDYEYGGRRNCDCVQIGPQAGIAGVVTPTFPLGRVDHLVNIPDGFRATFDGDVLQGSEGWRGRLLKVSGLNVMRFETGSARGRIWRNRTLRPRGESGREDLYQVNDQFVYRTVWAQGALPVIPHIVNDTFIDVSGGMPAPLSDHLKRMFESLCVSTDALSPSRRLRLETRYAYFALPQSDSASGTGSPWHARVPVLSPQRLLPPQEVSPDEVEALVRTIAANLSEWRDQFDPARSGSIVWDVLIYSSLSVDDVDKPLLRLSRLELPIRFIESWA